MKKIIFALFICISLVSCKNNRNAEVLPVNDDNILTIYVTTEDWIDDENLDCEDYELEGYEDSKSIDRLDNKIQKIYICSPLRGNIEDNINKAKEYCKFVVAKMKAMPVCPHIYFTQFLHKH